ncbi:hypothetical protein PIB30_073140, partial [Stylosanthes scabra]|nr:hypothetical protein [Stylosanthes scabra]
GLRIRPSPAPILPDTDDQLVHYEVDDIGKLEQLLDRNHDRMEEQFNRQSLPQIARCWLCTQSFATWWSKYFTTHTRHIGPGFSNMKLPLAKTKTRGKVIALESRKRSTRGCSSGLSPNKALRIGGTSHTPATTRVLRFRTTFSNRESSPIDAHKENEERQEVSSEAPLTSPALEAPSPTEHAHSEPQEQDLNLLLSQAKQVYSLRGKFPLGGGTDSKETTEPEAVRSVPSASATLSTIAAKIIFTVKDGLANIKSANNGLSDKLKCYEGNKASLTSAVSKAESDMGKARASYNAAEKKVEAFDKLCAHLKLSLGHFI